MMVRVIQRNRILRNYRNMGPSRFHAFNGRVRKYLAEIPEATWGANRPLISSYFSTSDKHDAVYHESMQGSRLVIAGREVLQAQIVDYLDEIASILEAVAVRNSDILLVCGFDLGRERRSQPRTKAPFIDVSVTNAEEDTTPTT